MADDSGDYFGWIMTGVSAIITVLTGVVSKLYLKSVSDSEKREASLMAEHKKTEKALESRISLLESKHEEQRNEVRDCHKQREELRVKLAGVETRLELLEQKIKSQYGTTE